MNQALPRLRMVRMATLLTLPVFNPAAHVEASRTPVQERTFEITEGVRPKVAPALDPRLGPDGRELPALRWYPSAHLPPVSEPYIFHYYAKRPEFPGAVGNSERERIGRLEQRGILPPKWFYGPQKPSPENAEGHRSAYMRSARRLLPPGHPDRLEDNYLEIAIAVDEWQATKAMQLKGHPLHPDNPYGLIGSIQGMIDAKALNPELFIMVYWRGEKEIAPALRHEAVDLLVIEGAILKRGARARKHGYIDRTVFMHGYLTGSDDLETVENRIREIRERFPEMPGMALYTGGGVPASYRNDDEKWLRGFDELLRKYFVDPAPEVYFTAPRFEASLDADRVKLEAEAEGKNGRPIRQYRWFVDNRLVAETAEPTFEWDTTREWPGRHMLSVHAIDEDWNRAASQIPVRLIRP